VCAKLFKELCKKLEISWAFERNPNQLFGKALEGAAGDKDTINKIERWVNDIKFTYFVLPQDILATRTVEIVK
jgi:hypothetical protein